MKKLTTGVRWPPTCKPPTPPPAPRLLPAPKAPEVPQASPKIPPRVPRATPRPRCVQAPRTPPAPKGPILPVPTKLTTVADDLDAAAQIPPFYRPNTGRPGGSPTTHLAALPDELFVVVADYDRSPTLSHVSRRLRDLLAHRHVLLAANADFRPGINRLSSPAVHSLSTRSLAGSEGTITRILLDGTHLQDVVIKVGACEPGALENQLDLLSAIPTALRSLILDVGGFVTDEMIPHHGERRKQEVMRICDISDWALIANLESLSMDLTHNGLEPGAFLPLAALSQAPKLRRLQIALGGNRWNAASIDAVGALGASRTLRSLTLDLSGAQLVGPYMDGFHTLSEAPNLRHLSLDLSNNLLGCRCQHANGPILIPNRDSEVLGRLADNGALQTLILNLSFNHLGPGDVPALMSTRHAHTLEVLSLDLSFNSLGPADLEALSSLREAPALRDMTLGLKGTQLATGSAQSLGQLREAPRLQRLTLFLSDNLLGAPDARALATLKDSRTLTALQIDLSRNWLRMDDVILLEGMRSAPSLRHVLIDCFENQVSRVVVPHSSSKDLWLRCALARSGQLAEARREALAAMGVRRRLGNGNATSDANEMD